MSELPVSWVTAPLGDIADVQMGQSPDSSTYNDRREGLPFFQGKAEFGALYPTARKWCSEPLKIAKSGDILLSVRAPVGPTNIAAEDCCIGRGLAALRVRQPLQQKYLLYFFRNIQPWLAAQGTGTTFAAISGGFVRELDVVVAPPPEQKRIADKLDALLARVDACRTRLDRVPGILKRFRQSVLAAATSGDLTREWRKEHRSLADARSLSLKIEAAHAAAGGHKLGNAAPPTDGVHDLAVEMFPSGWSLLTLRDLVLPERPITYGILKPGPERDNGVPYVRVADFPNDRLNLATIRKTSPAMDEEFKRSRLKRGDLLLSIRGTVGRLVVVPPVLERANITQDTARLSIQPEVNSSFVLWVLRSELIQQRMRGAVKGVAVRGINIGDVRALQVPLPSRAEQDEIVRRVDELLKLCDVMTGKVAASHSLVGRLTQSLLAKAFRGELVPQDPTDEPASELLAHLRARVSTSAAGPERPRPPRKERTMKSADRDAIKAAILKLEARKFSFDDLRSHVPGDYEALKAAVFELLEGPAPALRQVFSAKAKAMQLERVGQ